MVPPNAATAATTPETAATLLQSTGFDSFGLHRTYDIPT